MEASGEAEAEAYIPKQGDGSPKGVVVIKGQVRPLVTTDSVTPARPAAAAAPEPAGDPATDDVPF